MDFAHSFRPVTTAEYYAELASGTNIISAELISIVGQDLTEVLKVQRDPWLWCEVLFGLNYDIESSDETAAWILDQDDCDALIAIAAYSSRGGFSFCGEASHDLPLRKLTQRVKNRPFKQSAMLAIEAPCNVNGPSLYAECQKLLADNLAKGNGLQSMPEGLKELLFTPLNGTIPRIEYMVGEEGLWMVPVQLGQSIN